jgi:D-alanine-D-alanine ligase
MVVSTNAGQFGKVAVLMGGCSAEREISLLSGGAVLEALKNCGVDAHGIDVGKNIISDLVTGSYQRAFIILHGRGGEDGTMQGLLEQMNLPYTGSGVMASSLAMDKLKTKQIWQAMALPTPDFCILDSQESCQHALDTLSLPLIIKPVLEGSSIGMSKVETESEMVPAWQKAQQCGGTVIAEKWIEGDEYTAAMLDDRVLPMIKLKTTHKFYDYEAKYNTDDTQYICPCGLPEDQESTFRELTAQAFRAVGASAWGRVDLIVDGNGEPWLIEVNTVPGMTSHSLVPMAAKHAGMEFEELVVKILSLANCESC